MRFFVNINILATVTLLVLSAVRADSTDAQTDQDPNTHLEELIEWVHENGGFVAEGVSFGYENSIRGLIAGSKGFKAGEVIMDVPNSVIMLPIRKPNAQDESNECAEVARIHEELNKGEDSHWWKYLRMDDSLAVRTVALWDNDALDELQGLPPATYTPRMSILWYAHFCKNDENARLGKLSVQWYHEHLSKNEKKALWMFHTRRSINGMIPVWNLMNHHNGLNNMVSVKHVNGIQCKATVDILPGGTIHNSYGARTSDRMFRNYGFVEAWPQTWSWCSSGCSRDYDDEENETRHRFVLYPDGVAAIEASDRMSVCASCTSLEDFQTAARQHTQGLDINVLGKFVSFARLLLDKLPTSIDQDVKILKKLKTEIQSNPDWKSGTMLDVDANMSDTLAAVEYRLQFKQAVHSALDCGVRELGRRQSGDFSDVAQQIKNNGQQHEPVDVGDDEQQVSQEAKTQLDELIGWVYAQGGYVADGVAFGYENSIRGLVAGSKGLKAGEIIMDIPNTAIMSRILKPDSQTNEEDQCAQISRLHNELNKGENSHWWKYLRMDDSLGVRTVVLWEDAVLDELQGLPPYVPRFAVDWYASWCKNQQNIGNLNKSGLEYYSTDMTQNEKQALWVFVTRSSSNGMIPLWDLTNHHNGLNNMYADEHANGIRYRASIDIPPGGTIHNSYGMFSSDRIFRSYGFVESWPQIWSWCSAGCTHVYNNEEGETRHRFVLFPDSVVAIEAENSRTICNNCLNIEQFKTAAHQHTQQLGTSVLVGFVTASRALLDELPTSVDEDYVLLKKLKAKIESRSDWKPVTMISADTSDGNVRLADMLAAVEYRMQFKQAVQAALVYGVRLLDDRRTEL